MKIMGMNIYVRVYSVWCVEQGVGWPPVLWVTGGLGYWWWRCPLVLQLSPGVRVRPQCVWLDTLSHAGLGVVCAAGV